MWAAKAGKTRSQLPEVNSELCPMRTGLMVQELESASASESSCWVLKEICEHESEDVVERW